MSQPSALWHTSLPAGSTLWRAQGSCREKHEDPAEEGCWEHEDPAEEGCWEHEDPAEEGCWEHEDPAEEGCWEHEHPAEEGYWEHEDPAEEGCWEHEDPAEEGCWEHEDPAEEGCWEHEHPAEEGCWEHEDPAEEGCWEHEDPAEEGCWEHEDPAEEGCWEHEDPAEEGCWEHEDPAEEGCWEHEDTAEEGCWGTCAQNERHDHHSLQGSCCAVLDSRPLALTHTPWMEKHLLHLAIFFMEVHLLLPYDAKATPTNTYGKRWRLVQYLSNELWKRWRKEYLTQLKGRAKWKTPQRNVRIRDLVLLKDDDIYLTQHCSGIATTASLGVHWAGSWDC